MIPQKSVFFCLLLATPCPVFGNGAFSISPTIVADEVAPTVRALVLRLGHELIDYHERMAGHPQWFPDTVHPSASGTTVMAALAYQVVVQPQPPPAPADLAIRTAINRRAILEWPTDRGGYVLQASPALDGPRALWNVTPSAAVNDGTVVRVESIVRGAGYFRLWKP